MKKIILATALAAVLPVSFSAIAAEPTAGQKDEVQRVIHEQFKADAARLNLTPEQKNKIAEVIKEHKKDLMDDIRDELDDSQKQEFDKLVQERKGSWKN